VLSGFRVVLWIVGAARQGRKRQEWENTMRTDVAGEKHVSPMRLLEMLADRFGAFEAIAYSSIKLARFAPPDELAMDLLVANAVLEFGDDLREAAKAVTHSV
jgi:hypothetical protein